MNEYMLTLHHTDENGFFSHDDHQRVYGDSPETVRDRDLAGWGCTPGQVRALLTDDEGNEFEVTERVLELRYVGPY